jgi:hypothetical protein
MSLPLDTEVRSKKTKSKKVKKTEGGGFSEEFINSLQGSATKLRQQTTQVVGENDDEEEDEYESGRKTEPRAKYSSVSTPQVNSGKVSKNLDRDEYSDSTSGVDTSIVDTKRVTDVLIDANLSEGELYGLMMQIDQVRRNKETDTQRDAYDGSSNNSSGSSRKIPDVSMLDTLWKKQPSQGVPIGQQTAADVVNAKLKEEYKRLAEQADANAASFKVMSKMQIQGKTVDNSNSNKYGQIDNTSGGQVPIIVIIQKTPAVIATEWRDLVISQGNSINKKSIDITTKEMTNVITTTFATMDGILPEAFETNLVMRKVGLSLHSLCLYHPAIEYFIKHDVFGKNQMTNVKVDNGLNKAIAAKRVEVEAYTRAKEAPLNQPEDEELYKSELEVNKEKYFEMFIRPKLRANDQYFNKRDIYDDWNMERLMSDPAFEELQEAIDEILKVNIVNDSAKDRLLVMQDYRRRLALREEAKLACVTADGVLKEIQNTIAASDLLRTVHNAILSEVMIRVVAASSTQQTRKIITIPATGANISDGLEPLTKNLTYIYTIAMSMQGTATAGFVFEVRHYYEGEPTAAQKLAKPSVTSAHSQKLTDKWLRSYYLERYYSYDFWACSSLINQWPLGDNSATSALTQRLWSIFRQGFPKGQDKSEAEYVIHFIDHPPQILRERPTFKRMQDEIDEWEADAENAANLKTAISSTPEKSGNGNSNERHGARSAGTYTRFSDKTPAEQQEIREKETRLIATWKLVTVNSKRTTEATHESQLKVKNPEGEPGTYRKYTATKTYCGKGCKHNPRCNGTRCAKCGLFGHKEAQCGQLVVV